MPAKSIRFVKAIRQQSSRDAAERASLTSRIPGRLGTTYSNHEEDMTADNFSVSQDDQDFQRARALHNWKVDLLVASKHIDAAVQHFESASAAVEPSARYAAANSTIVSCGAAIAAAYSICIDKAREGESLALALTFLGYGLWWDDEKRAAVGQLLKSSAAATQAHSTQIRELAEKTLNDTRLWLASEQESHGR